MNDPLPPGNPTDTVTVGGETGEWNTVCTRAEFDIFDKEYEPLRPDLIERIGYHKMLEVFLMNHRRTPFYWRKNTSQ